MERHERRSKVLAKLKKARIGLGYALKIEPPPLVEGGRNYRNQLFGRFAAGFLFFRY
jgi:hypothetical protein